MERAWVMLKRSRGQGRNFWDAERRLHEWIGSHTIPFSLALGIFGEFDILLIVEASDLAAIGQAIRRISRDLGDDVISTTTYLATGIDPADKLGHIPAEPRLHCCSLRTLPGTGDDTRIALKALGATLASDPKLAGCRIHAADVVFGDYDLMVLFSCPYESAYDLLAKAAASIPTIRKTTTMLGAGFRI